MRSTRSSPSQGAASRSRFTAQEHAAEPKPVPAPASSCLKQRAVKPTLAPSFAVRLCFLLPKHLRPCPPGFPRWGHPKLTGIAASGAEGSSSQLPRATMARECLSGWLVADLYVTGSEWGFCAPFTPLCTTEVRDNENGNILPVVDI